MLRRSDPTDRQQDRPAKTLPPGGREASAALSPGATADPSPGDYHQHFAVEFQYPVAFTRALFDRNNPLLARTIDRLEESRRHRALVLLDSGVADAHPGLVDQVIGYFTAHAAVLELVAPPRIVPGGAAAKNAWDMVQNILAAVADFHLDRQSYIIAVGGGSVLDMVGFAASIAHRGLRLVRVPTTTLAQNDAGVGVKNAMDLMGRKNFAGTFAPPFAVLNDALFLNTLSFEDWIGGVAEAFKVAIIRDRDFFGDLEAKASHLRERHLEALEAVIRRCAVLHLDHIRQNNDPFEFGSARPLDFGHWSAHKLESLSGYRIFHGQAVAVGIALDSFYAMRRGLVTLPELQRIVTALAACGLPVWHELLAAEDADGTPLVLAGVEEFREHLGGRLNVTLPKGIGERIEVHHLDTAVIREGIDWLRRFAG